jgi:hypothetical protein
MKPLDLVISAHAPGIRKTQDEWIEYWNKEGKYFASMPDYYKIFKKGKIAIENLSDAITSTRIIFDSAYTLCGEIIHNYGSSRERSIGRLLVPPYFSFDNKGAVSINQGMLKMYDEIYRGADLRFSEDDDAFFKRLMRSTYHKPLRIKDKHCSNFLKALFDTEDDLETIFRVLNSAFDRSEKDYTTRISVDTHVPTHQGTARSCGFRLHINFPEKCIYLKITIMPEIKNSGFAYEAVYNENP